MRLTYSFIFCLFFTAGVFAQKNETLNAKDKKIIEHFENNYKKKNYKKFEGKIAVYKNYVTFDDKTVSFDPSDKATISILQNGLIYPQLISDYQAEKYREETTDRTQKRFMKIQKDWKAAFDIKSLKLSLLQELSYFKKNSTVKRFKVSSKNSNLPNSVTYFFELTNDKADAKTSMSDFLNGARLTYFDQEWYD
ncbi:hypothetical protein ASG31_08535 [Chryseobacterium sp. Leaf404]|uniref:hypothetical protein n=1 Tax=unclassified Chryseobacterium TaxID=2593645 RepID=UPI0006F4509B|nr:MULTISPECIES: hypothetical protein [unclassified Chryseobacterium]KQT17447.1 hypothetical protein ASG31_08535 [Chryseobacterium sp. Leaf404]